MQQIQAQAPPNKKGKGCLVGAIVGAAVLGGVVVALLIGGGILVGSFGLDVVADQVRSDIQDNPVILEHLGNIEEIDVDFAATANIDALDVFVFNLKGAKGNAILTAECITIDDDTEDVTWGRIRVDSGETFDLFPDQGPMPE